MTDERGTAGLSRTPELLSVVEGDLRDPSTIEDVAAAWSDALLERGDDDALRRDFERWYERDPAHAAAFDRIDGAYRELRAASGSGRLRAMENDTLARLAAKAKRSRRKRRVRRLGMAAAASVVVAAAAGILFSGDYWRDLRYLPEHVRYALVGDAFYRTGVGERLTATLDDGSVLTLNTDSRAVVQYGDDTRGVRLLAGQALFEVAHDAGRPFEVHAGGRKITALGTAFDVRVTGGNLEVTLIEGRVSVEQEELDSEEPKASSEQRASNIPQQATRNTQHATTASANSAQPTTILQPGQQLVVAAATPAVPVVREADVRRITSWRDGQVLFEDEPLVYALQEINRYSKRRVVLADEDLAKLRVSGAFNASKTEVFVEMLTKYFPIRIVDADNKRIVLGHKASGA